MGSSISLYTTGNMASATILAITSAATGFPKENLLDDNPDTYWKASSASAQTIDIDLGSAKAVSGLFLFIHNYSTLTESGGIAATITLYRSSDNITYTQVGGLITIGNMLLGPMRYSAISSITYRYWRLIISNCNEALEISGIWLASLYTLSIGNEMPERDKYEYNNTTLEMEGGRTFVAAINKNPHYIFPRIYRIDGATIFGYLKSAHQDSAGQLRVLMINEGSDYTTCYLVRFSEDSFDKNEIDYQYYNPTVSFIELPWIRDNEAY